MEIKSIIELIDTNTPAGFGDVRDVVMDVIDENGNVYKLELKNRKKANSMFKKSINWCNGWLLAENILQLKPEIKPIKEIKQKLRILNAATVLLNEKYFPNIKFPAYADIVISNLESLNEICSAFERFNAELKHGTSIKYSKDERLYLTNISLYQFLTVLNCYELTDSFFVEEIKTNDHKLLHKYNYEYFIGNINKYNFPDKDNYKEHYQVVINFMMYSDTKLEVNSKVDLMLEFDENIIIGNNYIVSYLGIYGDKQSSQATNESIDKRCFVVTAAIGDNNHYMVEEYRKFRDLVLLKYEFGQIFVRFYYKKSPPFADFISKHPLLKSLLFNLLIKPVYFGIKLLAPKLRR